MDRYEKLLKLPSLYYWKFSLILLTLGFGYFCNTSAELSSREQKLILRIPNPLTGISCGCACGTNLQVGGIDTILDIKVTKPLNQKN